VQHQPKQLQALHEILLLHQGLIVALVEPRMLQVLPLFPHYYAELNLHFEPEALLLQHLQVDQESR
jgi:hypothetical protein